MNNSFGYSIINTTKVYYPFGMVMPNRSYAAGTYRFGFNGKENDNEVKGSSNQQDYGMRIYDTRLGKFLSVDPLTPRYPELTPFQFGSNNPIQNIDLDGLEGTPAQSKGDGQTTSAVSTTYTPPAIDPTNTKRTLEIVYQTPPNAFTELKKALNTPGITGPLNEPQRIFTNAVYNIVDDAKAMGSGLLNGPNGSTNLEGIGLNPKEYTNAGVNTISLFGTIGITTPETAILKSGKIGLAEAKALGTIGEEAVGIIGPKTRIPSLTGTAKYRIPDRLTATTIEEVKNVSHLTFSAQLKDFLLFSQQNDLKMVLHTRPGTTFSGQLQGLIDNGSIIRKPIPYK